MPVYLNKKLEDNAELSVWKIAEQPAELLQMLASHGVYADLPFFRNENRLREWLTARLLLAEMGVKQRITYTEAGKPALEGATSFISISHTGDYVAVINHPTSHAGIDIERKGDRIFRVKHKFVNENEIKWINPLQEMDQLYVIWGAKECAFKIYGIGNVDFREHLEVKRFSFQSPGQTTVLMKKPGEVTEYEVFYQNLGDIVLTYAIQS